MSFQSAKGSALLTTEGYSLLGAVGSTKVPTISTANFNSGNTGNMFATVTLPKGLWLCQGTVTPDNLTNAEYISGFVALNVDGNLVNSWNIPVANVSMNNKFPFTINWCIASDGTTTSQIQATITTETGTQWTYSPSLGECAIQYVCIGAGV